MDIWFEDANRGQSTSIPSFVHLPFLSLFFCFLFFGFQMYQENKRAKVVEETEEIVGLLPSTIIVNSNAKQIAEIFAAAADESLCSERDLQEFLDNELGTQNIHLLLPGIEYRSTCDLHTFGNLKPDILFVKSSRPSNAEQTVCLIELKFKFSTKGKKKNAQIVVSDRFADDDKQQVVIYNEYLLDKQPRRPSVVSLLCNSQWALLIKSSRRGCDAITHAVSSSFRLNSSEGKDVISKFFSMSMKEHSFCVPDIPGYSIQNVLGVGSFSVVYRVRKGDEEFAAKVHDKAEDWRAEYDVLCKLASISNVPKVIEKIAETPESSCWNTLIICPVACHVEAPAFSTGHSLTSSDISDMIDVLKGAHELKIIHRDIRPPNLLLCEGSGVLVSDWGCALMGQDGTKVCARCQLRDVGLH